MHANQQLAVSRGSRRSFEADSYAVLALFDRGHRGVVRLVLPRGLLHSVRANIAPEAAERIGALLAAGRLDVCAGDVTGAAAYGDTFVVDILPRGRTLHVSERYDWIVTCTPAREFGE